MNADEYPTRDSSLIGAAGVHYVVSELSLRGLIALPTIRNTAGVDIIATNKEGTWQANLQVKSSRSRVGFWPVGKRFAEWVSDHNFYIFLRFDNRKGRFEVFMESSGVVAAMVTKYVEAEKNRGGKEWAPCYYPKGQYEELRLQWEAFGRGWPQPEREPDA